MAEFMDPNGTSRASEAGPRSEQVGTILTELRSLVLDGTLPPGTKLKETELAARFGVSRTPIREALVAAEREGLVTYELNRGYAVRHFTLHDLLESYELRGLLEGYGARVVAERGLPLYIERSLWACLDKSEAMIAGDEPLKGEDLVLWRSLNVQFHTTLMNLVPSSMFDRMFQFVYQVPKVFDVMSLEDPNSALRRYNGEHRRILEAIARRQSGRAEFLMREHLTEPMELIRRHLADSEGVGAVRLKTGK